MKLHFKSCLPILFLFSCITKSKNEDTVNNKSDSLNFKNKIETKKIYRYNDTVAFPWRTEEDSGYYKGYIAEKIETEKLNVIDTNSLLLHNFIYKNINRSEIKFLNDETLAHSVFINKKNKIRYDTLSNKDIKFVSIYKFGDIESQKIFFNGKLIENFIQKKTEPSITDIIFLNEKSYKLFTFKGKKYCYFDADLPYTGGSVDNICLQIIYCFRSNKISSFYSCRFISDMLYGDVDGDDNLDYLNFDNNEFCTLVPSSYRATFRLYSMNETGEFVERFDKNKKAYAIEGNTGESYMQDSFIIKSYNWPVPIK